MGIGGVTLPPDPIQQQPTYEGALAAFEAAADPVRILFDNGAGGRARPALSRASSSRSRSSRCPATKGRSWYLGGDGALRERRRRAARGADGFTWDADARPPTNFSGNTGGRRRRPVDGDAAVRVGAERRRARPLSYVTPPLEADTTAIGAGLRARSGSAPRRRASTCRRR